MKRLVDQVNNAVTSVLYTPVFSDSTRGLKETGLGLGTCLQNDIAHQKLNASAANQRWSHNPKPTSNLQLELYFFYLHSHSHHIYISLVFFGFIKNAIHRGIQRCLETAVAYPAPRQRQAAKHPLRVGHLDLDGHLLSAGLQPSLALAGPWYRSQGDRVASSMWNK